MMGWEVLSLMQHSLLILIHHSVRRLHVFYLIFSFIPSVADRLSFFLGPGGFFQLVIYFQSYLLNISFSYLKCEGKGPALDVSMSLQTLEYPSMFLTCTVNASVVASVPFRYRAYLQKVAQGIVLVEGDFLAGQDKQNVLLNSSINPEWSPHAHSCLTNINLNDVVELTFGAFALHAKHCGEYKCAVVSEWGHLLRNASFLVENFSFCMPLLNILRFTPTFSNSETCFSNSFPSQIFPSTYI